MKAIPVALREAVAIRRFQRLMNKTAGKLMFANLDE